MSKKVRRLSVKNARSVDEEREEKESLSYSLK